MEKCRKFKKKKKMFLVWVWKAHYCGFKWWAVDLNAIVLGGSLPVYFTLDYVDSERISGFRSIKRVGLSTKLHLQGVDNIQFTLSFIKTETTISKQTKNKLFLFIPFIPIAFQDLKKKQPSDFFLKTASISINLCSFLKNYR